MMSRRGMWMGLWVILLVAGLLGAAAEPDDRPRRDGYDPEALAPSEVVCGRVTKRERDAGCHCMRHRLEARKEAEKGCEALGKREAVLECFASIELCALPVRDVEDARRENMPARCKRSCSRARCRCCHS